jgi:valyl-tRNA synthetase
MSKSKGNGVDPMDLIEKYGADGLRFTIASFAGETQDVRLPVGYECPHCGAVIPQELKHQKAVPGGGKKPRVKCPKCKKDAQYTSPWFQPDEGEPVARIVSERFEYGRNFCNKLWNAARFAMMNLEGYTPGPVANAELAFEDRWILSRLATVTGEVTALLDRYQFDQATRALREFVWNEFCDWYLEMIKPRLRDESQRATAQRVLVTVLDLIVRLLHPFTPFITEELWQTLNEIAPERPTVSGDSLKPRKAESACIIAAWPTGLDALRNPAVEEQAAQFQQLVVAIRNVRGTYNITSGGTLAVHLRCPADMAKGLEPLKSQFPALAKAELAATGPDVTRPKSSASFTLGDLDGYVPLEGLIDFAAELARQEKEAEKLKGFIANTEKKLSNSSFVDKAPPDVVADVRQTLENQKKQLTSTEEVIEQLKVS